MKYKSTNAGYGYVVRLEKGEKLIVSLVQLAQKEGITGFFYGVGAVKNTTIGRRNDVEKQYEFKEVGETMELASINGNISMESGEYKVHAHGVLGDESLNAIAGHIQEAEVAVTVEIFVHLQHGAELVREHDEATGLSLLEFK